MTFPFLRKENISTDKKRFIRQLYAKYQFEILANSLSFQTPKIFVTSKRLNQDPAVHVWRTHTTWFSRDEMKCDSARDKATPTILLTLPNTRKLDCASRMEPRVQIFKVGHTVCINPTSCHNIRLVNVIRLVLLWVA